MEPFIQFALIAAKEAIQDSGWVPSNEIDCERMDNDWLWHRRFGWYKKSAGS